MLINQTYILYIYIYIYICYNINQQIIFKNTKIYIKKMTEILIYKYI